MIVSVNSPPSTYRQVQIRVTGSGSAFQPAVPTPPAGINEDATIDALDALAAIAARWHEVFARHREAFAAVEEGKRAWSSHDRKAAVVAFDALKRAWRRDALAFGDFLDRATALSNKGIANLEALVARARAAEAGGLDGTPYIELARAYAPHLRRAIEETSRADATKSQSASEAAAAADRVNAGQGISWPTIAAIAAGVAAVTTVVTLALSSRTTSRA